MPGYRTSVPGRHHRRNAAGSGPRMGRRTMITTHFDALTDAVCRTKSDVDRITGWRRHLAGVLTGGGRLLACGNGGSAAEAQDLTAELVGRFRDEHARMAAISLHADTSGLTAIANHDGQ